MALVAAYPHFITSKMRDKLADVVCQRSPTRPLDRFSIGKSRRYFRPSNQFLTLTKTRRIKEGFALAQWLRAFSALLCRPVTTRPVRSPFAVSGGYGQDSLHVSNFGSSDIPGTKW